MTAAAWKGGQGKGFWRNTGYLAADTYSFSRLTPCVHPLFQPLWPMQVPVLLSQSPLGSGSSRALISSCVHAESMENHNLTMLRYSLSLLPWVTPGPWTVLLCVKGPGSTLADNHRPKQPRSLSPSSLQGICPGAMKFWGRNCGTVRTPTMPLIFLCNWSNCAFFESHFSGLLA